MAGRGAGNEQVVQRFFCLLKHGHLLHKPLPLKDFKQGKMEPSLVWGKGIKGLTRRSKDTEQEEQPLLKGSETPEPNQRQRKRDRKLGCSRSDPPFGSSLGLQDTSQNLCRCLSPGTSQRKKSNKKK